MSTSAATLLSRITSELSEPINRNVSTDSLNKKLEWLRKLQTNIEAVDARLKPLLSNKTYSDMGRAQQIASLADTVVPDFKWMAPLTDDLNAAIARLEGELFTVASPIADGTIRELRAGEVRADLRDFEPTERDVSFLAAMQADQMEVAWALLNGPTPLVSDEVRIRALDERAKRLQPDAYATYQDLEILRESMTSWRQHISMWLTDLGAPPEQVAATLKLLFVAQPGYQPPPQGPDLSKAILSSVA